MTLRTARLTTAASTPWGVLVNKKDAKLSGGHIAKGATVAPAHRSRYNGDGPDASTPLGLGYVEGVLAVLFGIVGIISYDPPGLRGRVTMRSTGGPTVYSLSWRQDAGQVILGGFTHSDGQATYQAAVVALAYLVVLHRASPSAQTEEIVQRWYDLVGALEAFSPRANQDAGWPRAALADACANDHIRAHIERVCDSLYHAMRYALPALAPGDALPRLIERGVLVQSADPLAASDGTTVSLPGTILINPGRSESPVAHARPESPPASAAASDERDGADTTPLAPVTDPAALPVAKAITPEARPAAAAVADNTAPASAAPSTPRPAPRLFGGHVGRVRQALEVARGPLFLCGPTSTGKTTLAIEAGSLLGMGLEVLVCDPGMDAPDLFGSYARATACAAPETPVKDPHASWPATAADGACSVRLPVWAQGLFDQMTTIAGDTRRLLDEAETRMAGLTARTSGDWEAIDGPITRWARRAISGERVLLVIDELARAHESAISAVMRVLNTFDGATVVQQGLYVPPDAEADDTFHVIDVWMTRERLVVPASRVKIIATANIGDRYTGLDLSDPAFRRRWTGGWLHLGGYTATETGQILADRLGLPVGATLIAKLTAVAALVEQYQRSEDRLLATLDLATLITWGQVVMRLHSGGMAPRLAWETAASNVWIERIVPLKGAEPDPDVRAKLLGFVTGNAPGTLR